MGDRELLSSAAKRFDLNCRTMIFDMTTAFVGGSTRTNSSTSKIRFDTLSQDRSSGEQLMLLCALRSKDASTEYTGAAFGSKKSGKTVTASMPKRPTARSTTQRVASYQLRSSSTVSHTANKAIAIPPSDRTTCDQLHQQQHTSFPFDWQHQQQFDQYQHNITLTRNQIRTPSPRETHVVPMRSSHSHSNSRGGPWTAEMDEILIENHKRMKWDEIAEKFFHNTKTGNACRKRHARVIMERREDNFVAASGEGLKQNEGEDVELPEVRYSKTSACSNCGTTELPIWKVTRAGLLICNDCGHQEETRDTASPTVSGHAKHMLMNVKGQPLLRDHDSIDMRSSDPEAKLRLFEEHQNDPLASKIRQHTSRSFNEYDTTSSHATTWGRFEDFPIGKVPGNEPLRSVIRKMHTEVLLHEQEQQSSNVTREEWLRLKQRAARERAAAL